MKSVERPPSGAKSPFNILGLAKAWKSAKHEVPADGYDMLLEKYIDDGVLDDVPPELRAEFGTIGGLTRLMRDAAEVLFEHDLLRQRFPRAVDKFLARLEKEEGRLAKRGGPVLPDAEVLSEIGRLSEKRPRPLGLNINPVRGAVRRRYFNIDDLGRLFMLVFVHPGLSGRYGEWLCGNYWEVRVSLLGLLAGFSESPNVPREMKKRYGSGAYKRALMEFETEKAASAAGTDGSIAGDTCVIEAESGAALAFAVIDEHRQIAM